MGNTPKQIGAVIGGLILMVIGYALSRVLLSQAATAGSDTNAPSFSGFQGISDLGPVVFISAIILAGVGLIGAAGAGFIGRGPLRAAVVPLLGIAALTFTAATTGLDMSLGMAAVFSVVTAGAVGVWESFCSSRKAKHLNSIA